MLRTLTVKNFAVVSELRLELSKGLVVFTGETGAGKSILIEALGFLLGARGSLDWIRAGAQRLEVTGTFDSSDLPQDVRAAFKITEPKVVLRRELALDGKARAYINSQSAPLQTLASVADGLVDFHGQHEHQTLLKPRVQLDLLDGYGGLGSSRGKVSEAHRRWSELRSELSTLRLSDEERLKRIDMDRFQLTEIDEAALRPGEEEEIEAYLPRLKNAERLCSFADQAHGLLYDQEGSVQENLLKAERAMEELSRIDPSLAPEAASLEQARILVNEVSSRLADYRDPGEASPQRLDELLSRLDRINRLKKKYGKTAAEILAYRDKVAAELSWLENSRERTAELEAALARAEEALAKRCADLHKSRLDAAVRLSAAVARELKDLGLASAKLSVSVEQEEGRYGPAGSDEAEFLIAPNPGEPLKPLKSVASGGELSRVMLALKTVLAEADKVGILVFDEVDAGVGGVVGRVVGKRLAELGRTRQILCVTHLPQVACAASAHFHVSKEVSGGRTNTRVEALGGDRRLEAVALMLGGVKASTTSLRHARELLEECKS